MWRSLTLDQTWQATRFTYKYCICLNVVLSFCSICPLVAYFLKKNYSLRQNILKNLRVWEKSLTSVLFVFIWILFMLGLEWEQAAWRNIEDLLQKSDRTLHRTLMSSVRSVHRRWTAAEGVTELYLSASGQKELQRLVDHEDIKARWPDSGCIRSRFQRI